MADSYSRFRNQKQAEAASAAAENGAQGVWGGIGHSGLSVLASTAASLTAPLGAIDSMLYDTGHYSTLDPNNMGTVLNTYGGKVRETVSQNILGENPNFGNKAWATVYQAGMSALDNLARIAAAGGTEAGSLALAGLGSFGQGVAEASANGAEPWQAAGLGLISGASEVVTEKIGLDRLFRTAEYAPDSLGQVIKEALKQSGSEILEEELTFLTGLVAEALILRDRSPYKMRVAELMDSGMSYDDAVTMANQELGKEAWDTAVQSALSGFMMSVPASAHAEVTDRQNRPIRNQYAQQAEARLTELGVPEDQVENLARAIARQHMGYDLSRKDANLIKGSQAAQDVLGEFQESDPLRKLAEEAAAEQAGVTASQATPVQAKTATAETAPTQTKAAQTVTQTSQQTAKAEPEIDESWMDFDVNAPAQPAQAKAAPQEAAQTAPQEDDGGDDAEFFQVLRDMDTILEAKPDTNAKPSRSARLTDGKTADIAGVATVGGGEMTLRLESGETVPMGEVVFGNDADRQVYQAISGLGISADEANVLLERYYAGEVNGAVFSRGVENAFTYGKVGMSLDDAMSRSDFVKDIGEAAAKFAHEMGVQVRKATAAKQQAARTGGKTGKVTIKAGSVVEKVKVTGKLRKTSIEGLKVLAEATGINIVVDTNLQDNANGIYDPATNTMFIDANAGADYSGTMLFTAAHELTHMIKAWNPQKFDVLADFLVEQYGKHGKSVADLVAAKKDLYAKNGKTISDELAFEEVIADSMEAMLQDGTVLAKLRQRDQTVWEKIRDYINQLVDKIRKAYGNLKPDSVEGQTVAAWTDVLEQIQDMFVDAVLEAGEIYQGNGADVSKNQAGEVLFSLKRDSEFSDNAIARNQQTGKVKPDVMQKAKAMRGRVADRMRQMQYDKRVALPEDVEGNTYIANSSYDGTEENTTVCPRSLAAEAFMDAVGEMLGRPLTVQEQIYISQDLQGRTLTPECLYCYVATDRKAYRAFLGNYVQQRDAVIQAYKDGDTDTSRTGKLYQKFLDGRKDTANMWKRFNMWIDAYKNGKPMVQASHLTNMSKLMGDIQSEFGADLKGQIKDAMAYAQSASWAKKRIGYVAYNGHILKWKQDRINKLNSHYGLRMYSFSDFSPAFILENMQMVTDAAVRGLKMLGYTKELDFVKIFAPTGMNINVSTFGFEQNGVVGENSLIGAPWEEAKALRKKYPNVGITFVATNDTLVEWALDQDWIDVVIPYHLVRTGTEVAKALKYTNYTSESADTKDKGWQKGDQKFISPTEHDNDFDKYMAALKKNHLRPRFERFISHPNYMKLVNETRQPASSSKAVQPVFDEDAANESLAKLEANGYYRPVGDTVDRMYEIAAEVAEKAPAAVEEMGGKRFSLRAPVEQVGDLVAVHNLNITTLLKSLRLGGMPMPSVAVIKAGDPHPSYGNVSVVFSRSTVDPENDPRNRIYGTDVFTPTIGQALRSGLSPDASPEEYVKAMLSLGRRGVGQDKEAYSLMSYAAPEYSSIAQAKADIGRLDLVGLDEGLDAVLPAMERAAKVHDELAGADPQQREKVFEAMASAAEQQKRGDGIGEAFREHGISISKEQQDDLDAAFSELSQVPTTFFEAKPERVVRPDEWSLVVVPDNTDPEALEELRKAGLNVKTYQAFREESRVEVINSMPELRFSLRDPGQQKAAAQLQKENQKLREDIAKLKDLLKLQRTVTNGTKFTKTSIEAAAAKLIKDTGAKGSKAELAKLLETFYETIVQQKDPTLETVQEAAAPAAEWLAQHMEQGSASAAEMMLAEQELIREVYDSYWSVSTLRTFADVKQAQINRLRGEHLKRMADLRAKHKAKVQELKAEHREALQRVKAEDRARLEAKLAEQRAQYQASRKESIESRHRTEMRHKIQRVVKQLNDLLLHESKDKHVPERLKKVVTEALELFDMDTVDSESRLAKIDEEIAKTTDPKKIAELMETRKRVEAMGESFQARMEDLEKAYAEIRAGSDATLQAAFDAVVESKLAEAAEKVGNTKLRNMSMEQLEAVYDAYKMVLKSIRDANKAFKAGKNQTIVQMGEQAQEEIRKVGGEHETSAKLLDGIKGFKWANLKPIYAMRTIGSDTLTKLFQNLRNGEDTWAKDIYEARDFFRQQRDKFHFDKWDMDKTYSFQSTTGKEFKLTLQQIMSLYAYSRRHQADQHLYKGGFVFDSNTEVKRNWKGIPYKATVNTAAAHNLTPEILADIVSKLTPEQKGFVESMQSYLSDVMGAKGNEVSMAMYDVRLFKEKNYFPLKSSKLFIYQHTEAAGEIKLKNSGFTKGTKPQAGNPIILQDFMDVWAGHVNDMSLYHAMVLPLEDFNRVLNYTGPNTADTDSVSVKTALQNAYGTQAYDYLSQMLKDINGGARADRDAHWINRWTTRFKKGATFASLSVVFQQPSAIARAFAVIDHKYFIGKRIDAKQHKAMWEEVKKYAGVARIKEMGQFDINMGRTTSEFITAKEYGSLTEKAKAMFADSGYRDEVFGRLPALADEVSWVTIWDAVKRETAQRNPGMNTHSEEFLTKAGERFTEVITLTQVYDSVLSRSQMMRSKDTGVKMATAFMAEPTTTVNMLADGILQTKRGNKKYFGKVLGAVVTSNLINSMLAALVYAARDDDEDETYWEKYLSSFVGKFFDSLNPLTYLPLLKDVVSIIQGYDVERSDMALFADIWNAWGKLDNKDYSAWRKVEDFAGSIAKVFGLPIQNIMRDLRGLWQVFAKSLPLAQGTAAGSRYAAKEGIWRWMGGGEVSNQQQLYDAYLNGDTAHANRVAARYKDQSAVETALRKALRENDPRIHEAALAKIAEDFERYDELLSQIEAEGHFVKRLIAGAVEAEINEILPDKESQPSTREKSYYDAEDFGIAFYHGDQEVIDMVRQDLVDTYVLNGKSLAEAEKAFQGDARSGIKEQYEAGAISDKEAVSGLIQYGGKTKEEAERLVREWRYTAETGHNHGDLKNNFISGRIDRKELISTLMTVNGYSREKATDQADQYEWERDYPELQDRITWAQYKKWRDNGKAGGVNFDTFIRVYDYRKNGGDTREWKEVESYINSLSLTDKQKDALWLSIYESEEKLKTLIWNR